MTRLRLLALFVLVFVSLLLVLLKMLAYIVTGNERMFSNIAVALDRAGNVAMNGAWWQTISGRAGQKWPRAAKFVCWLFQDPQHCANATLHDVATLEAAKDDQPR